MAEKVCDFGICVCVFEHFTGFICYTYVRKTLNHNGLNLKALFLHKLAFK